MERPNVEIPDLVYPYGQCLLICGRERNEKEKEKLATSGK